jgi:hypothetical protein
MSNQPFGGPGHVVCREGIIITVFGHKFRSEVGASAPQRVAFPEPYMTSFGAIWSPREVGVPSTNCCSPFKLNLKWKNALHEVRGSRLYSTTCALAAISTLMAKRSGQPAEHFSDSGSGASFRHKSKTDLSGRGPKLGDRFA